MKENNKMAPQTLEPKNMPSMNNQDNQAGVVKKMPGSDKTGFIMVFVVVLAIFLGVGSGWTLANSGGSSSKKAASPDSAQAEIKVSEDLLEESAEGVLKEGGINGEGTHRLERGMGQEKDVALLSTVLDLSSFEGKKVQIWGKSITSPNVGWLMDVGKVKLVE